jgi:hypothetical protein
MGEKPSSRKRHRWSLEPGDLVETTGRWDRSRPVGIILSVYSANVYEGSSAEVLIGGQRMLIESKYLVRIDPDPDISAVS